MHNAINAVWIFPISVPDLFGTILLSEPWSVTLHCMTLVGVPAIVERNVSLPRDMVKSNPAGERLSDLDAAALPVKAVRPTPAMQAANSSLVMSLTMHNTPESIVPPPRQWSAAVEHDTSNA